MGAARVVVAAVIARHAVLRLRRHVEHRHVHLDAGVWIGRRGDARRPSVGAEELVEDGG